MDVERQTRYKLELTQHEYEALFGAVRVAVEGRTLKDPYRKTAKKLLEESGR